MAGDWRSDVLHLRREGALDDRRSVISALDQTIGKNTRKGNKKNSPYFLRMVHVGT